MWKMPCSPRRVSSIPKKDGSYHKLEIKTNDKDLKVLARKGYYAMPDEKQ